MAFEGDVATFPVGDLLAWLAQRTRDRGPQPDARVDGAAFLPARGRSSPGQLVGAGDAAGAAAGRARRCWSTGVRWNETLAARGRSRARASGGCWRAAGWSRRRSCSRSWPKRRAACSPTRSPGTKGASSTKPLTNPPPPPIGEGARAARTSAPWRSSSIWLRRSSRSAATPPSTARPRTAGGDVAVDGYLDIDGDVVETVTRDRRPRGDETADDDADDEREPAPTDPAPRPRRF